MTRQKALERRDWVPEGPEETWGGSMMAKKILDVT